MPTLKPSSASTAACAAARSSSITPNLGHEVSDQTVDANRRLQPLRYLRDCSDCFRLERLPGGACTHWKAPPFHGARQKQTFAKCDLSVKKKDRQLQRSLRNPIRCFYQAAAIAAAVFRFLWQPETITLLADGKRTRSMQEFWHARIPGNHS